LRDESGENGCKWILHPCTKLKNIAINPEILKLIAEIDEFKGRWKAIETVAPEKLTTLRRIATIESVGSSTRIEGDRLSDTEVEKLLSGLRSKSFASRDEQEVAAYTDAMDRIFDSYDVITNPENTSSNCTAYCSNTARRTRNIAANTRR
jgi:Fic family protein